MHKRLIFRYRRGDQTNVRFPELQMPVRWRSVGMGIQEKRWGQDDVRTKTDTGTRGEYPKALERTAVKELGNLTP